MTQKRCLVCKIVYLLVIVGALNWGLVGIFQIDPLAKLLESAPVVSRILYGLVGIAGLIMLIQCFKECPACKK